MELNGRKSGKHWIVLEQVIINLIYFVPSWLDQSFSVFNWAAPWPAFYQARLFSKLIWFEAFQFQWFMDG